MTYIALGSNLGNKELNLQEAIGEMQLKVGEVLAVSAFHYSEPQGFDSENSFVNAVVYIDTPLDPFGLLEELRDIEKSMGRTIKSVGEQYSDRVIDLDILLYENHHIDRPELKIPHPRMRERDFVMKPLRELPGFQLEFFKE
jgi:2-amino-4-hydroxy-6-hydroxymethyldihydropteridine diphosphokinase